MPHPRYPPFCASLLEILSAYFETYRQNVCSWERERERERERETILREIILKLVNRFYDIGVCRKLDLSTLPCHLFVNNHHSVFNSDKTVYMATNLGERKRWIQTSRKKKNNFCPILTVVKRLDEYTQLVTCLLLCYICKGNIVKIIGVWMGLIEVWVHIFPRGINTELHYSLDIKNATKG